MIREQLSYDPFDYLDQVNGDRAAAHALARRNRDIEARIRKERGYKNVRRFTLTGQLEKYQSMGVAGRGYRNVYYVEYEYGLQSF